VQGPCFATLARVSSIARMSAHGLPGLDAVALQRNEAGCNLGDRVLGTGATALEICLPGCTAAAFRLSEVGAFVVGARPNISLNADAFRRPLRGRKPAGRFRR